MIELVVTKFRRTGMKEKTKKKQRKERKSENLAARVSRTPAIVLTLSKPTNQVP